MIPSDPLNHFILDPSLLQVGNLPFLQEMLEENVSLIASENMSQVLHNRRQARALLELWDFTPRDQYAIVDHLEKMKLSIRLHSLEPSDVRGAERYLWPAVNNGVTWTQSLARFVVDEISLGLTGYPILAAESSSWRIVEFMKRMGIKVKDVSYPFVEEKLQALRAKGIRRRIAAFGAGLAFVYLFFGSRDLLEQLGVGGISAFVVDP